MLSDRNRATALWVMTNDDLLDATEDGIFTTSEVNRLMDAARAEAVEPSEDDVERVARALCEASAVPPDMKLPHVGITWTLYRDLARAAIRAMRDRP